jgi:electron transfer flavoprotein beta subunit
MALSVKDEQGGTVTAISVGQPGDVDVLRECLYRGADAAVRVDAEARAADAQGQAALIAAAIKKIESVDLILAGTTVVDGESSLLAAHVSAVLGWEQVSYVDAIESIGDGQVAAKRAIEMGYETVEAPLPAVVSVGVALFEDDPRTPRSAKAMLKLKAKKVEIPTHTPAELGVDLSAAAKTAVTGYEAVPERTVESQEVDADSESALKAMLAEVLKGE